MDGIYPKYVPQRANPAKYLEFVPDVIFYRKNYIILGENHQKLVYIEHNKQLLNRYLYLIRDLALHFGIYFEGKDSPEPTVSTFVLKYQIRGKYKTWDQVPLTKMGYIIGDTFGGSHQAIAAQMNTNNSPTTNKSLVEVLSDKSTSFQDTGQHYSIEDYRKLFKDVVRNRQLELYLDKPYSKAIFKEFHAKMAKELETENTPSWKLVKTENIKRGKCLRQLCETRGGLYFVGSSHIDLTGCKDYHFI